MYPEFFLITAGLLNLAVLFLCNFPDNCCSWKLARCIWKKQWVARFSDTDRWVLKYWCCLLPPPVKPLGIVIYQHPNASVSAWKQLSMLKQIHLALGTDTQDSMLSCLSDNTLTRLLSYVYCHRLQAHWHGCSLSSTGQLTKLSSNRHSFNLLAWYTAS